MSEPEFRENVSIEIELSVSLYNQRRYYDCGVILEKLIGIYGRHFINEP